MTRSLPRRFSRTKCEGRKSLVDLGWEDVRGLLRGFFFVDRIHGEKYRAAWEEIRLLARFSRNLEGR